MNIIKNAITMVTSIPKVIKQNPFTLTFNVKFGKETIAVRFVGPQAKLLQNNFRKNDYVKMTGMLKGQNLLLQHITLDKRSSTGRNLNVMA